MDFSYHIQKKANQLSKLVLSMTSTAGSGHPSSSLSLVHLVTTLMYHTMKYDPQNPWDPANDRIILSEGHAVPVIYAAYADLHGVYGDSPDEKKTLTTDDLGTLRQINSPLDGHPNPSAGFPFFDCATGSLGQGLSYACGLSLASRLYSINKHFYVIIGDGESREGQIWEACDFIMDYKLHQIIPIFNCNGLGQTGKVSNQQSPDLLSAKLKAYGFKVHTIDGHNPSAIADCFSNVVNDSQPNAIIALTVKGWGVPQLHSENSHGKPLKPNQLDEAYQALDSKLLSFGNRPAHEDFKLYPSRPSSVSLPQTTHSKIGNPDFNSLLAGDPFLTKFSTGIMSTRRAYGVALREAGKVDDRIVVLDGDVSNSTFSNYFAKEFPGRFFECRIAEQNMISTAAGFAKSGKIPFVSSFSKFLVRGYDQLELSLIAGANLRLCGSHTGANIAADGPSQMGLTDIGYLRSLSTVKDKSGNPIMTIFTPSCAVATYKIVQLMIDLDRTCYLRTIRHDLPLLYEPSENFEIGDIKLLHQGKDIAILASGYMVHACKKIIEDLAKAGLYASLYDCYCIPINPEMIFDAAMNNNCKIITVEDNYGNGLGAEVASIISEKPSIGIALKQLFVSRIPKSGLTAEDVLDFVEMGI